MWASRCFPRRNRSRVSTTCRHRIARTISRRAPCLYEQTRCGCTCCNLQQTSGLQFEVAHSGGDELYDANRFLRGWWTRTSLPTLRWLCFRHFSIINSNVCTVDENKTFWQCRVDVSNFRGNYGKSSKRTSENQVRHISWTKYTTYQPLIWLYTYPQFICAYLIYS